MVLLNEDFLNMIKQQNELKLICFNELNKNRKLPEQIHHYCSLSTCINILKHKELWLTSIEKMNDSSERDHIHTIIETELNFYKANHIISKEQEEIFKDMIDTCAFIKQKKDTFIAKYFTCCFSEEKNLLSQWRAYGDKGKGVSISFDIDKMSISTQGINYDIEELFLTPSIYDEKVQQQIILRYIEANLVQKTYFRLSHVISCFTGCFKHNAFSEEKEWRILSKCILDDKFYKYEYFPVEYRDGIRGLSPYMRWKFGELSDSPIAHITLGPQNETLIEDMKSFLASIGLEHVTVSKSEIPYRD